MRVLSLIVLSLNLYGASGNHRGPEMLAVQPSLCAEFNKALDGGYCIYPGSPQNQDVIYYFHGRGDASPDVNARRWGAEDQFPAKVREYWNANGAKQPTVIAISYGAKWLFSADLLHLFYQQQMPTLEAQLGITVRHRVALGEGIGGFNALQVALRTDRFERAAVLCAPITDGLDPFVNTMQLDNYVAKSSAYASLGQGSFDSLKENLKAQAELEREFFPTIEQWSAADPLALARGAHSLRNPVEFYISAGYQDEHVSFEGNTRLVDLLKERTVNVEWRPQWGGYCSVDVASLAEFLRR